MRDNEPTRRQMLRTSGLVGLGSLISLTGLTSARKPGARPGKGNNYGNTNGLGAWLKEPAEFKDSPIWSDGVHDYTGMENVTVYSGAMTSVNIPEGDFQPHAAPVSFAPQAIKVSPGTTVTFEWLDNADLPFPFPVPHNVVSLREENGVPEFAYPGKFAVAAYDSAATGDPDDPPYLTNEPVSFDVVFDEPGNHLYYCTPHGAPFVVDGPFGEAYNEFGMRGAVIVSDEE